MAITLNHIDLKDLESELTRTKTNVDSWAKQRTEFASFTRDSHQETMQDQSGEHAAHILSLATPLGRLMIPPPMPNAHSQAEPPPGKADVAWGLCAASEAA